MKKECFLKLQYLHYLKTCRVGKNVWDTIWHSFFVAKLKTFLHDRFKLILFFFYFTFRFPRVEIKVAFPEFNSWNWNFFEQIYGLALNLAFEASSTVSPFPDEIQNKTDC